MITFECEVKGVNKKYEAIAKITLKFKVPCISTQLNARFDQLFDSGNSIKNLFTVCVMNMLQHYKWKYNTYRDRVLNTTET